MLKNPICAPRGAIPAACLIQGRRTPCDPNGTSSWSRAGTFTRLPRVNSWVRAPPAARPAAPRLHLDHRRNSSQECAQNLLRGGICSNALICANRVATFLDLLLQINLRVLRTKAMHSLIVALAIVAINCTPVESVTILSLNSWCGLPILKSPF